MTRQEYEMSEDDLKSIITASQPVPYMVFAGREPATPQQNANRAWESLSLKMGFRHMTALPSQKGERYFTAEPRGDGNDEDASA